MRASLLKNRQHASLLLGHVLLCLAATSLGGPVKYSSGVGNIKGDVLVLDVSSLTFQGNHPIGVAYTTPVSCQEACATLPGCSGWTFCNSTVGCGSGCSSYVKANPKVGYKNNQNPTIRSPDWKIPVAGFGPWGLTSGCMKGCGDSGSSNCQESERWPYGMCSLKKALNPDAPTYWSRDPKEGWISGTVSVPANCKGVSPAACDGCMASSNPGACLTCAASPKVLPTNLLMAVDVNPAPSAGCINCYTRSKDQRQCADCILQGGACSSCPLDTYPGGDVDACISCSKKHGEQLLGGCRSCALMRDKAKVPTCLSCLDAVAKVACPAGVNGEAQGYSCLDLTFQADSCSTCASTAADPAACQKCLVTKPHSPGCAYCALISSPADQSRCYQCRAESKVLNSACSDCMSYLPDPVSKQQCMDCLKTPSMSAAGKSWCFGCQNWYRSNNARDKCIKCLATPQADYVASCSRLDAAAP